MMRNNKNQTREPFPPADMDSAMKNLRISEAYYRTLFEESPIALMEFDFSEGKSYLEKMKRKHGELTEMYFKNHIEVIGKFLLKIKVTDINQAAVALYKARNKEELISKRHTLYCEETHKSFIKGFLRFYQGEFNFENKTIIKDFTGKKRKINIKYVVSEEHRDTFKQVLTFHIDPKERKGIEWAYSENRLHYQTLFEMSPDILLVFDNQYKVITTNSQALALVGLKTQDELSGRDIMDYIIPEHHSKIKSAFQQLLTTGIPQIFECTLCNTGGNPITIEVKAVSLSGEERAASPIMIIGRDITERKDVESSLRNLTAHLQRAREEERAVIARELHDELGQTLSTLKIHAHWISKKLPETCIEELNHLITMKHLIDSTIKCVNRITYSLRDTLYDEISLELGMKWEIEEFIESYRIQCDPHIDINGKIYHRALSSTILKVLKESLTNVARHAMGDEVYVSLKEKNDALILEVRDNGVGITPCQVNSTTSFGIIGMKERLVRWGGTLKIQGEKGRGTALTVTVPLNRDNSK